VRLQVSPLVSMSVAATRHSSPRVRTERRLGEAEYTRLCPPDARPFDAPQAIVERLARGSVILPATLRFASSSRVRDENRLNRAGAPRRFR